MLSSRVTPSPGLLRALWTPEAAGIVLILAALLGMALLGGCSNWTPQHAGGKLAEGAGDYIDSPAGQAKVEAISARGTTTAIQTAKTELKAEWRGEVAASELRVKAGTGSLLDWLLVLLGGGGGAATIWSMVDRGLHGKRHAART